tara:strand:+ start:226 stop:339 length:114 start_codon:yes stop_codon:yes gene_type:complete
MKGFNHWVGKNNKIKKKFKLTTEELIEKTTIFKRLAP